MDETGAVWFVTGCSRGLGRNLVEAVVKQGARVVMTARCTDQLMRFADRHPGRVLPVTLDVRDVSQTAVAVKTAIDMFGRIDVLVNNAGYSCLGAVEEIGEADARCQFETNFFGPVRLIQAVLPAMRARRDGCIVNVSSVGGFAALPSCGQYSATKFALEGLSEALAQEVAPLGIKVMLVEPNGLRTDFLKATSLQLASPRLDAYAATSGAVITRFAAAEGKQPNDPSRGAKAIIAAVNAENGPFRLVLGGGGVTRVREKLAAVSAELDAWEHLSTSVSFSPDPPNAKA